MRVILASASPRRRELLQLLYDDFEVVPARGEESYQSDTPEEIVMELSKQKAWEVEKRIGFRELKGPAVLLSADTVVAFEGQILGKPGSSKEAEQMLARLSGNRHEVYTGITILCQKGELFRQLNFYDRTRVWFSPMTEQEIRDYVKTGEPMDKAGAYGIQGFGGRFVERIEGDYNNVVGLPVAKIYQKLKRFS